MAFALRNACTAATLGCKCLPQMSAAVTCCPATASERAFHQCLSVLSTTRACTCSCVRKSSGQEKNLTPISPSCDLNNLALPLPSNNLMASRSSSEGTPWSSAAREGPAKPHVRGLQASRHAAGARHILKLPVLATVMTESSSPYV